VEIIQRNIFIIGIIVSIIAIFTLFVGVTAKDYALDVIGGLGFMLLFLGLPIAIIGAVMKSNDQKKVLPSTRMCPKCGREIPFDAIVCPYCQHVLNDVQRHEF
jgi:energy-coupling factor transporter transmembrane protein EcfT